MTALTDKDKKYYGPIKEVIAGLVIPEGARVLDIGPDIIPFKRATEFVDWEVKTKLPGPVHKVDVSCEPLPFPDKSFDFIYCRQTLEDLYNPFLLCQEMQRVGKAGYIETPSPVAEMGRGVDVGSPPFRGYHHHRWVVWDNDGELTFVSKYPIVEHFKLNEEQIVADLRSGPRAWSTIYPWTGGFRFRHLQNPIDYFMPTEYIDVIIAAVAGNSYQKAAA